MSDPGNHPGAGPDITLRPARPSDADAVLSVLNEAAAWLAARGIRQWPARFEPEWISGAITDGHTWLACHGETAIGTVTVTWSDPLWRDDAQIAGYVHRLAVRRAAAGLGACLLRWAGDLALRSGRRALRLDCVASNHRLRAYYEAAGFSRRGETVVHGAPGQRAATGPATAVSRYELLLRD